MCIVDILEEQKLFSFKKKGVWGWEHCAKLQEDARQWFEVHKPILDDQENRKRRVNGNCNWCPTVGEFLKCNVGVSWSRGKDMAGRAWTVRNNVGEVIMHRRRAFTRVKSIIEAKNIALIWTIGSMISHRLAPVVFETEDAELLAVKRPSACHLTKIMMWRLELGWVIYLSGNWRWCQETLIKLLSWSQEAAPWICGCNHMLHGVSPFGWVV